MEGLILGLEQVFSLYGLLALLVGVFMGVLAGATPGISPSMAVALLVPFSFGMDATLAFILFVAVYQAANYGGSITAITINTPGTASAMVTGIEGYEMNKTGRGGEALSAALSSSVFGGIVGAIILMLFAIPAASVAIKFSSFHYFLLALFGILTIVVFAGKGKKLAATVAVLFGMLLATIGLDNFTGEPRFTFGLPELLDGIPLIPTMIGIFALGEVFKNKRADTSNALAIGVMPSIFSYFKYWALQFKSAVIGTFIGILPGAGATVASLISYTEAKRSRPKDNFGKGEVSGVVASEAANSSSVGGALIPLLALGIPGSATDAVLLGAFTLHGMVAGPALFQKNPEIVYAIFISVIVANIVLLFAGRLLNKLWINVTRIKPLFLNIAIVLLCIFGCYSLKNSWFDVYLCFFFGFVGLAFHKLKLSPAALILGLVLGGILENNFRRMMITF